MKVLYWLPLELKLSSYPGTRCWRSPVGQACPALLPECAQPMAAHGSSIEGGEHPSLTHEGN